MKRLHYDSKQVAKVTVNVPPGDTLEVSDDVAAQLQAASTHFKVGDAPAPQPAETEPAPTEESEPEGPARRGRRARG